ncbi:MAG TPA: permease [Pirellulaceae bacterium]|nr:permease [Pirellulaceae bacterium]
MSELFWASYLRFAGNLLHAVPTLFIGFLIAAVFAQVMRRDNVQKLFGERGLRSLAQAWLIGMLLPVCALGVLPVLREMRRQGVSAGAMLAFGLTAPLFNPISVLYGLTLSNPWVILLFCLGSLVIVAVAGTAWNWLFGLYEVQCEQPAPVAPGYKRILSMIWYIAREMTGPTMVFVLFGLLGVTLLGLVLPFGSLQFAAEADDPLAPAVMGAVSILAYSSPIQVMVLVAGMFEHGNSAGAAFSLLVLGAGLNLATIVWLVVTYGWRPSLIWLAMFCAVTISLAYTLDKPLFPAGVSPAGHTHAFDDFCFPFSETETNPRRAALYQLASKSEVYEYVFLRAAVICGLGGLAIRLLRLQERLESWLAAGEFSRSRYDPYLPSWLLWISSLGGLVAFSIAGCFLYYPPPEDVLSELRQAETALASAALSRDYEVALHWVGVTESWMHKLAVGTRLRGQTRTPYQEAKANLLLEKLELLEHAVKRRDAEQTPKLGLATQRAGIRLRNAMRGK